MDAAACQWKDCWAVVKAHLTTGSMSFSWIKSAVMFHCWEAIVVTDCWCRQPPHLISAGEAWAGVWGIIEMTRGPVCTGKQVKPEGELGGRKWTMNQGGGSSQRRNRIYSVGRTILCDYGIKNTTLHYKTGAKLKARPLETKYLVLRELNQMKYLEQYLVHSKPSNGCCFIILNTTYMHL